MALLSFPVSLDSPYFYIAVSLIVNVVNLILGGIYLSRYANRRRVMVSLYAVIVVLFQLAFTVTFSSMKVSTWLNGYHAESTAHRAIWLMEHLCPAITIFLAQAYFAYQIKQSLGESTAISSALVALLGFGSLVETLVITATHLPSANAEPTIVKAIPAGLIAAQILSLFPNVLTTVILFPTISSIKQSGWYPGMTKIRNIVGSGMLTCGVQVLSVYIMLARPSESSLMSTLASSLYVLTMATMLNSYEEVKPSKEYSLIDEENAAPTASPALPAPAQD